MDAAVHLPPRFFLWLCVCVCVCARVFVCVYVCVCLHEGPKVTSPVPRTS